MRDGWLSWLTDSGWLNHKVVIHPASSLAQDRESLPAKTSVLTTMLPANHTRLQNAVTLKTGLGSVKVIRNITI